MILQFNEADSVLFMGGTIIVSLGDLKSGPNTVASNPLLGYSLKDYINLKLFKDVEFPTSETFIKLTLSRTFYNNETKVRCLPLHKYYSKLPQDE